MVARARKGKRDWLNVNVKVVGRVQFVKVRAVHGFSNFIYPVGKIAEKQSVGVYCSL